MMDSPPSPAPQSGALDGGMALSGTTGLEVLSRCVDVTCADPEQFRATLTLGHVGGIGVGRMTTTPLSTARPRHRLDDQHGAYIAMASVRSGSFVYSQSSRSAHGHAGDSAFVDLGREFDSHINIRSDLTFSFIPRETLAARSIRPRQLAGAILPPTPLTTSLTTLVHGAADRATSGDVAGPLVERAILDLTLAAILESVDARSDPEEFSDGYRYRVIEFIDGNFTDPTLDVAAVAAHLNISQRYLHRLFEDQPRSVYSLIRRRRIDFGVHLLTAAGYRHLSIGQIAGRSGFSNLSHFGRAVKSATGMTPRQLRRTSDANRVAAIHVPSEGARVGDAQPC